MNLLSLFSHLHAPSSSPLATPAAQVQSKASPVVANAASTGTNGSTGSSTTGSNSATITANDFLSLLVTEIQNQDPTSQTDPMTYITQLVGVNSLEQLVQINSTLSSGIPTTPSTTPSANGSDQAASSPAAVSAAAKTAIQAAQSTTGPAAAANGHLLPLGASGQATTASTNAVAQAFTHPAVMPQAVAPPTQLAAPTQVPLNPEVMRALEHSIPGAKLAGPSAGPQVGPQ